MPHRLARLRRLRQLSGAAIGLVIAAVTAGCGHEVVVVRVAHVATSTPGVAYVIVRPGRTAGAYDTVADREGHSVEFDAEYLLVCDGRAGGPLRCAIPAEVGDDRASVGPVATSAPPLADFTVGALVPKVVSDPKAAAASAPPPWPAAPPAALAPPAPAEKNLTKEKKK